MRRNTPKNFSHRRAAKDFTIRARCSADTKTLLSLAANTLGLDESSVMRMAIKHYATSVLTAPATPLFNHAQR